LSSAEPIAKPTEEVGFAFYVGVELGREDKFTLLMVPLDTGISASLKIVAALGKLTLSANAEFLSCCRFPGGGVDGK